MDKFRVIAINRHRFSTDGKGITTLIGLSNCPLKCAYCINKFELSKSEIKELTEQELLSKVMIDYCYFVATKGGITFGGGEPLLQSEMILKLLDIVPKGVSVNIETSLNVDNAFVREILDRVDELIIGIKTMNKGIYKKYTCKDNFNVLKWLKYIVDNRLQEKCTIKVPNIPSYTTENDIEEAIKELRCMGFNKVNLFNYIRKEENH